MALSRVQHVYAVTDCKLAAQTADTGGAPTYGTLYDVPGVKTIAVKGTIETKYLRGDNKLLVARSTMGTMTASVSHAQLSLDVWATMMGGAVSDTGSTPNQVMTYRQLGANSPKYFKLEAKTDMCDLVTGDGHVKLYKCMLSGFPTLGLAEEDFQLFDFDVAAMPCTSNDYWFDIVFNETAANIV